MAGHAGWAALSPADQDLLLKAALLSLKEGSVERRTPRLITSVEPQDFLIDHLLPRRGLIGMVGAPGEGKSWLGLELASLIGGAPDRFGGLDVRVQCPVWYFLAEDSQGFTARARAREQAHGTAQPPAGGGARPHRRGLRRARGRQRRLRLRLLAGDIGVPLVISDIHMPVMDGRALARELRVHRPAMPILFITGRESPDLTGEVLRKPFGPDELLLAVARMLGGVESLPRA